MFRTVPVGVVKGSFLRRKMLPFALQKATLRIRSKYRFLLVFFTVAPMPLLACVSRRMGFAYGFQADKCPPSLWRVPCGLYPTSARMFGKSFLRLPAPGAFMVCLRNENILYLR